MTSSPTIAIDQFFPYPPAHVWRVLTDPDLLARWLMPNDFQLKVGHRFTFKGTPMPKVKFSGIVQSTRNPFLPSASAASKASGLKPEASKMMSNGPYISLASVSVACCELT